MKTFAKISVVCLFVSALGFVSVYGAVRLGFIEPRVIPAAVTPAEIPAVTVAEPQVPAPAPVKPADDNTVNTVGGTLSIRGAMNAMRLLANGKDLGVGIESIALSFKQQFKINEADVVMVTDSTSATCQQYFFVTVASLADIKVTPSFGTCDDGPVITQRGHDIRVAMNDAKGKAVAFVFAAGVVTKQGNVQ